MEHTEKFVVAVSQMNSKAAKKHLERALRDKVSKKISETLREDSKKLQ